MKSDGQLYLPLAPYFRRVVVMGKMIGADPTMRHLDKTNGVWRARFMLDRGPSMVGERVIFYLGTGDLELAKAKRDLILDAYHKAGVKLLIAGENCQIKKETRPIS